MDKNKDIIKHTIDDIQPDIYMKTRIKATISDTKYKSAKPRKIFTKAISAVLCFAVLAFGTTAAVNHLSGTQSKSDGSILIAYAGTDKIFTVDELSFKETPIFGNITIINDNAPTQARKQKLETYNKAKTDMMTMVDEITADGSGAGWGSGQTGGSAFSMYYCFSGNFMLDLEDYRDVEKLTISNTSIYGQIVMDILPDGYIDEYTITDMKYCSAFVAPGEVYDNSVWQITNSITVSGEELQTSLETKHYELGRGRKAINKPCWIEWEYSPQLIADIEKNPDFDVTDIKDEVTFEVTFKNGDVTKSVVNINFDENGNMILS